MGFVQVANTKILLRNTEIQSKDYMLTGSKGRKHLFGDWYHGRMTFHHPIRFSRSIHLLVQNRSREENNSDIFDPEDKKRCFFT